MTSDEELLVGSLAATANEPAAPFPERVEAAARLWRLSEEARAALEPFKAELRSRARAELGQGSGTTAYDGAGLSSARVTVPAVGVVLTDAPELETARADLGPAFSQVYRVHLTLIPQTPSEVSRLPAEARRHLAARVRLVSGTPRVSLSILTGLEPMK